MTTTPLYVDSKGREHVIADMNPKYLLSALAKAKSDGWDVGKYATQDEHDAVVAALEAQAGVNKARYIGELEAEHDAPETTAERKAEIVQIIAELQAQA